LADEEDDFERDEKKKGAQGNNGKVKTKVFVAFT
jgi:hypothetical protein